jgi:predicted GNAT superfamily acetyltransferase
MRVNETTDYETVVSFLLSNFYPYRWTVESLAQHHILQISTDEGTAGFLWFREEAPQTLQIHVCVSRAYEGRWLTRTTLTALFEVGRAMGATNVVGLVDRPAIAKLYRRLGAAIAGPFAILPIPKDNDGHFLT